MYSTYRQLWFYLFLLSIPVWIFHGAVASMSKSWPTTAGRIIKADQIHYWARNSIAYQYKVQGKPYTSTMRDGFDTPVGALISRSAGPTRYFPGEQVTVYYCPQFPSLAVLQPGNNHSYDTNGNVISSE